MNLLENGDLDVCFLYSFNQIASLLLEVLRSLYFKRHLDLSVNVMIQILFACLQAATH